MYLIFRPQNTDLILRARQRITGVMANKRWWWVVAPHIIVMCGKGAFPNTDFNLTKLGSGFRPVMVQVL